MFNTIGITDKIVTTAILLARQGSNVLIVSTHNTYINKLVSQSISKIPATETLNCKIGWVQSVLDGENMRFDIFANDETSVIIFDNYCLNFDYSNLPLIQKYATVLTYDEVMKQNFEWIKN